MSYKKINDEVYYAEGRIVEFAAKDYVFLKEAAARNPRQRSRLCVHPGTDAPIHEMFIVHHHGAYVRPHKQLAKNESLQILEGEADVLLFDEAGKLLRIIELGDMASGKTFFYRMEHQDFHTLRIHSPIVFIKEVTAGPFLLKNTIFAPWSPDEKDTAGVVKFLEQIRTM